MRLDDFPEPDTGLVVTHFLVVSDQDRSRDYYRSVFGAEVVQERDPVVLKLANSWLIFNVGGGPRSGPSFAGAGGDRRVAGGHAHAVPVRRPGSGRRRPLSLGTCLVGLLTAPPRGGLSVFC